MESDSGFMDLLAFLVLGSLLLVGAYTQEWFFGYSSYFVWLFILLSIALPSLPPRFPRFEATTSLAVVMTTGIWLLGGEGILRFPPLVFFGLVAIVMFRFLAFLLKVFIPAKSFGRGLRIVTAAIDIVLGVCVFIYG